MLFRPGGRGSTAPYQAKYQAGPSRSMNHWCYVYGTKVTGVTRLEASQRPDRRTGRPSDSLLVRALHHGWLWIGDRTCSFQRLGFVTGEKDQMDQEHDYQHATKGADDGGAGGKISQHRKVNA